MTLGEKLKQLREQRGWTQTQAAEKLGISSQVVSNYERDYRSPDKDTLSKIAITYNKSIDWLLGVTDDSTFMESEDKNTEIPDSKKKSEHEYDYTKDPTVTPELRKLLDTLVSLPEEDRERIIDQALIFAEGIKAKNRSITK